MFFGMGDRWQESKHGTTATHQHRGNVRPLHTMLQICEQGGLRWIPELHTHEIAVNYGCKGVGRFAHNSTAHVRCRRRTGPPAPQHHL